MKIALLSAFILPLSCMSIAAFATDNKLPLEITADKALEWNQTDKTYVARGNALAQQGALSIKADVLTATYDGANGNTSDISSLTADGHVTLTSGTDVATGEKATYDLKSGQAVLSGGRPKIIQDNKNTLESDVVTVWTKNNVLDHAEATGNVIITSGDQTATGDKATYTAAGNTAELIGHVKINQGNNTLEGDKAQIDLTTHISKMTTDKKTQRVKGVFYPGAGKKN